MHDDRDGDDRFGHSDRERSDRQQQRHTPDRTGMEVGQ